MCSPENIIPSGQDFVVCGLWWSLQTLSTERVVILLPGSNNSGGMLLEPIRTYCRQVHQIHSRILNPFPQDAEASSPTKHVVVPTVKSRDLRETPETN